MRLCALVNNNPVLSVPVDSVYFFVFVVLCVVKNIMPRQIATQSRNGSPNVKMTRKLLITLQQTQRM